MTITGQTEQHFRGDLLELQRTVRRVSTEKTANEAAGGCSGPGGLVDLRALSRWGDEPAAARVLVVDDEAANRRLLARLLERSGHVVMEADTGEYALEVVARERPDVVLLDVVLPGLSGFEVCGAIKRDSATRLTPVVLVTALAQPQDRIKGLESGADDFLTKPVNTFELQARVHSLVRVKRVTDELDSAESVILSLALTIEARDRDTEGHCERLAEYSCALGQRLGLDAIALATLRRGGYLHDLGKVAVPDSILLKAGPLTQPEFQIMKQHTVVGDRLCGELRSLSRVRPLVRYHHERLDGSGYPDGLGGDDIPLLAQIIGIVDVFDALTTKRPYKRAMSAIEACDMLLHEVHLGWRRRDLVSMFVSMVHGNAISLIRPADETAVSRG